MEKRGESYLLPLRKKRYYTQARKTKEAVIYLLTRKGPEKEGANAQLRGGKATSSSSKNKERPAAVRHLSRGRDVRRTIRSRRGGEKV